MGANNQIENVGSKLLAGLTHAEIQELLDALWAEVSLPQREEAIAQLSPDTQSTIRQLLSPSPSADTSETE